MQPPNKKYVNINIYIEYNQQVMHIRSIKRETLF